MICGADVIKVGLHSWLGKAPSCVRELVIFVCYLLPKINFVHRIYIQEQSLLSRGAIKLYIRLY